MSQYIDLKQLPKGEPFNIEYIHSGNNSPYFQPHRHEYYEIVWSLSGDGYHSIDFVKYTLHPGQMYLIPPGQVHGNIHSTGSVCVLYFQPDFIEYDYRGQLTIDKAFYQNNDKPHCLQLDDTGCKDLGEIARILLQEVTAPGKDWGLIGALLKSFLRYITRYIPRHDASDASISERMYTLFTLIDLYFKKEKKACFYSGQLSLTNKRVNELVRQHCNKTLTRLIHDRIILEARRELAFTTKTVKEIAHYLGYEDPAYFCRFFRKLANESPLEFRERVFK